MRVNRRALAIWMCVVPIHVGCIAEPSPDDDAADVFGIDEGHVTSASTVTVDAAVDTYVRSGAYASRSFGTATTINVDSDASGTAMQGFVRFAVGDVGTIARATLRLYATNGSRDSANVVRIASTTWNESMTWNTKPSVAGPTIGTIGRSTSGAWVDVDVTSAVVSGQTLSLALLPRSSDGVRFASREATSNRPRLLIDVAGGTVADGGSATSDGGVATTDSGSTSTGGYNWYPGYYVLSAASTTSGRQRVLDDPLVAPFDGVQFRYHWAQSELAAGDYSAGFSALDADLAAVAARGKKILVMLMYKKFDGTAAVPVDLTRSPGAWCSGSYCGDLSVGDASVALLWNAAVESRLRAWISAMASHLAASPYLANVAGIVFNETSLSTTDTTILAAAGYDPYVYIAALEDNLLAATTAAPRLIAFLYFEGGFVSMDGTSVRAGQRVGDWMLMHPRTGVGTPDLQPKNPKGTNHPCANATYEGRIPCEPAVEAPDYALAVTDSIQQSFDYAMDPVPDGLHASFMTFSYAVGSGPNAFTFADVSAYIATHPVRNTARPTW